MRKLFSYFYSDIYLTFYFHIPCNKKPFKSFMHFYFIMNVCSFSTKCLGLSYYRNIKFNLKKGHFFGFASSLLDIDLSIDWRPFSYIR